MPAVYPVTGPFNTATSYSGTFIPTLWSSKLNAKFYTASVFGEIANTNWEGDIKELGDKVTINNIPDVTVSNYVVGAGLNYQVPTPSTITMSIDKGKYFAFQVNDVLEYQSKPKLMDMFSNDAGMQMKVAIDSTVIYNTFQSAAAANVGTTAGAKSGSYNLGSDTAPVTLSASTILPLLTAFSGVLDEQNVPETDRFLLLDPATRQWLMQSPLAQAQFMGDGQSMVRNGRIGQIDRFTVYVTNNLPRASAGVNTAYTSGDGSESSITSQGDDKRRILVAGHKSAITFASQMTKVEQVRNPTDFGDYVRGLNVYGYTVAKDASLTYAVVK
jgi:hypothetical protein